MVRKDWWLSVWMLIVLGALALVFALYVLLAGAGPVSMAVTLMIFGLFCLGLGLLLRHRLKHPSSGGDDAPN